MQNNETSGDIKEISFLPSTLKTIDSAVFEWLKNLNLHSMTNSGWKPCPIIWASAERSFQIKSDQNVRDNSHSLIFPLIVLSRTKEEKSKSFKGVNCLDVPEAYDYKGGSISVGRVIEQEKTSNFANADALYKNKQINFPRANKKIVYQNFIIPMPVSITVYYKINIKTNFMSQMNQLETPFFTKFGNTHYFSISQDGHQFDVYFDESPESEGTEGLDEKERIFSKTFNFKVLGYLIGDAENEERPKIIIRENAVEVKLPREQRMFGDIPKNNKTSFYR